MSKKGKLATKQIHEADEAILNLLLAELEPAQEPEVDLAGILKQASEMAGVPIADVPAAIICVRRMLSHESDRGCALAAASLLETELERLLRGYLVNNLGTLDRRFSANGALATFSSRIDLAYALGLISSNVHRALDLIRRIRNEFAHTVDAISFDHPAIVARCQELGLDIFHEDLTPRRKFLRAVFGATGCIYTSMNVPRVSERVNMNLDDPIMKDQAARFRKAIEAVLRQRERSA